MFESDNDFTDHSTANGPKKPKKKPKPAPPVVSKEQGRRTGTDYKTAAAERGAAMRELNTPAPPKKKK